jgi:PAS domain S-box-containing protein
MATNTSDLTAIPPLTVAELDSQTNPLADTGSEEVARLRAELEITRIELMRARAENARQLSIEQLHSTMLGNVLDAVIAFDNQQRIRYLNAAAERQYGVRARDVIGTPIHQLFRYCWSSPADESLVTDALQSTGRWRGEYQQELPDGTRLQVDAAFTVLRDEAGNALGTLACMRDVSDRASMQSALRDSEEQFRNWLMTIPAPIQIKDRDGRYLLANHWAQQALRTSVSVLGRDDYELMPRAAAERLQDHDREVLETNRPSQREQLIYDRQYLAIKFPLRSNDGTPTAVCGISIDVTDLKRAQSELADARDELSKQVSALTRLRDLATQPASGDDPDALLESILRTAVDLHDASHGLISLVDNTTGGLQAAASINLDTRAVRQLTGLLPAPGGGACGDEFSGPKRVVIHDIEVEPCVERFREVARRIGFRAVHSTPVLTRDGFVLGVLSVYFKESRRPTEMEMQVAEVCARQVADAIEAASIQQALRESEARFRTMADNAPVMVWVADDQHSCTYLSRTWCEFTGQNEADGLGFGWVNVVHPDDRENVYREFVDAVEQQRALRVECRFRRHDGTYRWCIDAASPRFAADGTFIGFVGSVMDITERKTQEEALRQSEKLYRAIGESLDYGIWICDADGRNRYVSESFLRLVGLSQDECSLFGWVNHLHPDEAQQTLSSWRECVRNGGVWNRVHRFKGVDGEYHSIMARGLPVRDELGNIVCWAGINLDVSREQQAEAALRETDRRKDDFLALLSHELRNPLAPIRSALEMLKLQRSDTESETASFTVIDRQLDNLVRLVDDLLDLSRINRGKLSLRPDTVQLQDIINSAAETARPYLDAAGHTFEIELPAAPVTLHGDRMRLAQMITNLLNNSAKYTPGGGHIKLRAALDGNQVRISVSDDGIGITADNLQAIFHMFAQLDPSRAHIGGGLGVGLALVKALAEIHGGRVVAESPGEGQGSTFNITLPVSSPTAVVQQPTTDDTTATGAGGSCRILIADDNADSAQTLAMLLDVLGHHTRIVSDGLEAVAAVQSFVPDFVFMDIGMPKLDGIEATRRIRELVLTRQPRIIAMTGWGQATDRERSHSAGMDHHLIKPLTLQTIQTVIAGAADTSSLH